MAHFIERYTIIAHSNASDMFEEYEKSLIGYNTPLLYRDINGEFTATIQGIERDGRILLKCNDGKLRTYYFKEVENVTLGY